MMEDGVEDFVVPPTDKHGETLEVEAATTRLDLFKSFLQCNQATRRIPDGEVFQSTWTGDDGLDCRQWALVVRQIRERTVR